MSCCTSYGAHHCLDYVLLVHDVFQGHFVMEATQRKEREVTHWKRLDVMSQIEDEFRMALAEKDDEKADGSKFVQQLRAKRVQENSKSQEAISVRGNALAEGERLQREVLELKQQIESTNAAMQDQVP